MSKVTEVRAHGQMGKAKYTGVWAQRRYDIWGMGKSTGTPVKEYRGTGIRPKAHG